MVNVNSVFIKVITLTDNHCTNNRQDNVNQEPRGHKNSHYGYLNDFSVSEMLVIKKQLPNYLRHPFKLFAPLQDVLLSSQIPNCQQDEGKEANGSKTNKDC